MLPISEAVEQHVNTIKLVISLFARRRVKTAGQRGINRDSLLALLLSALLDLQFHLLQRHKLADGLELCRVRAAPRQVEEKNL